MDRFAFRGGNFASGTSIYAGNPFANSSMKTIKYLEEKHNEKEILQVFRVYDHKNKMMIYSDKTTDGPDCFYFWTLEPTLRCTAHRFYENEMDYTKEVIPGIMAQIGIDLKGNRIFAEDILEFDDLSFDGLLIKNTCLIHLDTECVRINFSDFKIRTSMKASGEDSRAILYDCLVVGNKYEGLKSSQK